MQREKKYKYVMISPLVVVIVALIVLPLISLFLTAFDNGPLHIIKLSKDRSFLNSLKVTIVFVVVSVVLELLLGLILALSVSEVENSWIRAVLILPMMVAPTAVGLIWRLMFQPMFGVVNLVLSKMGFPLLGWLGDPNMALPSVIIVEVWQWTCFVYLILLAGLKSIPKECYEAALVDGASPWLMFRYVTLPLLKPSIYIAVLFRSIDAFKALDKFVTLTGGGPGEATEVLALHIYKVSFLFWDLEYGAFLAVIALAVVLIYNLAYTSFLGVLGRQP